MPDVIKRIEAARAADLDVTADTYARKWSRGSKTLRRGRGCARTWKPSSAAWDNEWEEVSGPESILVGVVKNPALRELQGQTHRGHSNEAGKDPLDTLLDILAEDDGFTQCAVFGLKEDDVALALLQPWISINNDSSGCFARGHSRPGESSSASVRNADVVVFDPKTIADRSTFSDPNELAVGMRWVLVNGVPVIAAGQMTAAQPGQVLRGAGYRPAAAVAATHW